MNAISLGLLNVALLCGAPEAPATVEVPAINEVLKQFDQEAAEIEKNAEAETKKHADKIIVELKKVQDAFCKLVRLRAPDWEFDEAQLCRAPQERLRDHRHRQRSDRYQADREVVGAVRRPLCAKDFH